MSSTELIARLEAAEAMIAAQNAKIALLEAPATKTLKIKAPKAEKVKKEPTNSSGPSEWNIFVSSTMKEMAASKGLLYASCADHKAFLAAAKDLGVKWGDAMKEASRRRDEAAGTDHAARVAKAAAKSAEKAAAREAKKAGAEEAPKKVRAKKVKTSAAPSAAPSAATSAAPSPAAFAALPTDKPEDAAALADFYDTVKDVGMDFLILDGVRYLLSTENKEVFEMEGCDMGERIGIFDEVLRAIDRTA
jgi:hypothetical protein